MLIFFLKIHSFNLMNLKKAKFSIGNIVRHKHFDFRGVIYDVDFEFNNSEEWYKSIPKNVRPRKDQPFIICLLRMKRLHMKLMFLSKIY